DRAGLHMIETRAGPLQILALPWITRHNLLTKEDLRLASLLEIETLLMERIENFSRTTAEALEPDIPTVLTIHGTIDGATVGAEPQARVTTAIEKHSLAGAVARVKIDATQEQAVLLRADDIQAQLEAAGAFHVAAIAIEVERANRGRLADAERDLLNGLTPRRALELYLRSKNTPEDRIAILLAAADELLAEQQ